MRIVKRIGGSLAAAAVVLSLLLLTSCGVAESVPSTEWMEPLLTGKHQVEIEVAGYGVIRAELDADAAPITVTNFIRLAESGFYDGLTFHRVCSGFVIQGGDPLGNGTGGSPNRIKGEFSANGVENPIAHERGVLSMARSQSVNSASSQFFIVQGAASHLDGAYAAFGRVTEGMEIVDAICANTPVTDRNGTVPRQAQPVITAIRVIAGGVDTPADPAPVQ